MSLREYYDLNIKTIDTIITDNKLSEKKNEEDISKYHYKALKNKKEKIYELLNKKRKNNKLIDIIENEEDIDKKKIKVYEYNDSFYEGDIFINQINKGGKAIDFGFLKGKRKEKIFIGFQVKNYSKDVKLSQNTKNSLEKLLAETSVKYNIYIKEWHYFMVSFYDPETKYYNEDIVKTCKKEGLEYMFYDPKERIFYDNNFKLLNHEIKFTFNSNLDFDKNNNPNIIFENFYNIESNINEYSSINDFKNKLYEKSRNFIKLVDSNISLLQLNRSIKDKLNGKNTVKLIAIYPFSKNYPFPIPNNLYLLLFINKNTDDYVYYYKKDNIFYCGYIKDPNNDSLDISFLPTYVNNKKENLKFLVYKLVQ